MSIIDAIEQAREQGGEPYVAAGKPGFRNPVKADTAPCLTAITFAHQPGTVLEMGTGYGFSTLHFALAKPDAKILTIELDTTVAEATRRLFDDAGLDIDVRTGMVADLIGSIDHPVDLVFIDHQPSMYLPDFLLLEPRLSPGAAILADNVTDRHDENADFLDYVLQKYPGTVIPTRAGLLYATVTADWAGT